MSWTLCTQCPPLYSHGGYLFIRLFYSTYGNDQFALRRSTLVLIVRVLHVVTTLGQQPVEYVTTAALRLDLTECQDQNDA